MDYKQLESKIAQLKGDFRHFKILVINGDLKITPLETSLTSIDELDFVSQVFPDEILTGSIALRIYGLLNRPFTDIDIILSPDTEKKYSGRYVKEMYGYEADVNENRLGTINFPYKKGIFSRKKNYSVDFFSDRGVNYQTVGVVPKFKLQDPIEIMSYKMSMAEKGNKKHITDLENIFANFQFLERKGLLGEYGVLFGDIR